MSALHGLNGAEVLALVLLFSFIVTPMLLGVASLLASLFRKPMKPGSMQYLKKIGRLAVILLVVVSGQACAAIQHADFSPAKPERAAWAGGAAADVITSQQAFDRGAIEANPLLPCPGDTPSAECMVAAKVLIAYPIMVLAEGWLASTQPSGKLPTWTKWLIWGVGGVIQGVIAWHNSGVGRE